VATHPSAIDATQAGVWKRAFLVVTPETVVRWHWAGFRMYWSLTLRSQRGLPEPPVAHKPRGQISRSIAINL
jgi:hypothetical protein